MQRWRQSCAHERGIQGCNGSSERKRNELRRRKVGTVVRASRVGEHKCGAKRCHLSALNQCIDCYSCALRSTHRRRARRAQSTGCFFLTGEILMAEAKETNVAGTWQQPRKRRQMQADRCAVLRHSAHSFTSGLLPVAMLVREASLLLLDWLLAAACCHSQSINSHVVQQQCHPHAVGVFGAFAAS